MKKKLLVFLTILVLGVLTGCGMTEEEAKDYVKASLDAAYKGEFDAFVDITESTPEGAKAMYEENIVHTMEAAGFSEKNLDEELIEKYEQFFFELAKVADYEVGAATKAESGDYAVEVTVRPLIIFDGSGDEVTEKLLDRIDDMEKHPSDEKIIKMSFEIMYDILSEKLEKPEYGEEVSVTINLQKNEEGMYLISEEDMLALDSVLFMTGQE